MGSDGATVEHLQQFLRDLTPERRTRLIAGLERALLLGEAVPGAELVLRELRRIISEAEERSPRLGNAARLFFTALEPFIVDDAAAQKHPGRIARAALGPIWHWIRRDFMAAEATQFSEAVNEALLAGDRAAALVHTQLFQEQFAERLRVALDALTDDEPGRWRFYAKISTPRAADDVVVLLDVLRGQSRLAELAAQLPDHLTNLAGSALEQVRAAVERATKGQPQLYVYAILVAASRLAAPWQIVRLAIKAAGSDAAARVAETPYAVAVTITLSDLERLVRELQGQLRGGRGAVAVTGLLKAVHDTARGLRTELALPVESAWGRQFGAVRTQISELLKSELEAAPGVVRRLLRTRSSKAAASAALDPIDLAQAAAMVDLVAACRAFAGELAINELSMRTYSELRQYLDAASRGLVEAVRHATPEDRPLLQAQCDAALDFCARMSAPDPVAAASRTSAAPAARKVAQG